MRSTKKKQIKRSKKKKVVVKRSHHRKAVVKKNTTIVKYINPSQFERLWDHRSNMRFINALREVIGLDEIRIAHRPYKAS